MLAESLLDISFLKKASPTYFKISISVLLNSFLMKCVGENYKISPRRNGMNLDLAVSGKDW